MIRLTGTPEPKEVLITPLRSERFGTFNLACPGKVKAKYPGGVGPLQDTAIVGGSTCYECYFFRAEHKNEDNIVVGIWCANPESIEGG